MPKRVLRRRQRKALFEIERVFWEEGFSELLYDAACEVFLNREGQVVLSRHYALPEAIGEVESCRLSSVRKNKPLVVPEPGQRVRLRGTWTLAGKF